jgi:Protein of unknown function (DUF4232)
MTTIDEIGRRAATLARADAVDVAAARVESGLERLRLDDGPIVATPRRGIDPRRWITIGTAAALIAAAIIALVVNANESETHRIIPGDTSIQPTTPSTAVATTSVASTEPPVATEVPVVTPAGTIAVSHDALPPAFPATSFLGITDQSHLPLVAIGDTRIVTVDSDASTATLIDPFSPASPDTPPQPIHLDVAPVGNIAAGPGDVLYGVVQGTDPLMSLVAIALSGDRAGQVVASAPISAAAFAEAPNGVLGHGADGIIDRRTGELLLGYVDPTGTSTSFGRPLHDVAITAGDLASGNLVVHDPDGAHDWPLMITHDSEGPGLQYADPPAAPSSHGGAVVWTTVGPPEDPSADVPTPTEPVIAVLAADGTGTWYSLTDGWQVAASDLDGTLLMRLNGSTVELARLDPPQRFDFLDQSAAPHQRVQFAATLPTTLATARPCTIDDLEAVPSAEGAMGTTYGVLYVRNKSDQPCQVSGVPDVAFLDDAGNIVQSTDPALLGQSQGAEKIVLERDSWATALLGAIASNVCGGNESSQFRLTIDGKSTIAPFAVGGPLQPEQCSPSNTETPVAGALEAQPYAPVQESTDLPNPFDNLDVTLDVPTTVHPGDVLRYDVVMTAKSGPSNGDKPAISVVLSDDCPIYRESLVASIGEFLLSCNGSDGILIAPGESVRFHIELLIPADAALGPATLTWTPVEPTAAPVTASITITA